MKSHSALYIYYHSVENDDKHSSKYSQINLNEMVENLVFLFS